MCTGVIHPYEFLWACSLHQDDKNLVGLVARHANHATNQMSFAARRIKDGEWLIIASNREPKNALRQYRKRWAIECMFGDAKTRGFNIEDTRITDPDKLDLWLAIIALTMSWTYRCATQVMGLSGIKKKDPWIQRKILVQDRPGSAQAMDHPPA